MTLLLLVAALLLTGGLLLRELYANKERRRNAEEHQRLAATLRDTRNHLRRAQDDLVVLRCLLEEKHLLDETDMASGRARFIDTPRRTQAERDELAKSLNVSPTHLVIGDDHEKVH